MVATTADIRKSFLSYFGQHSHSIVSSSSLVPKNDPTLLFTNAGMNQFKNIFTGAEEYPWSRVATAQKCVRAGGKHNDLENVGYTARHHTFFEMLGNFSFGDYFKETAIELAWTLLTREFGIHQDRLYVTVYGEDEEASRLWKKVANLSDSRIIPISTSDNFWSMGDIGPCGPCSEIFYDHGDKIAGGLPGTATQDGDRYVEIWNLVFMQYEQIAGGERLLLPKPSIDTGMGLERIAAVLQGTHDNYKTDILRALILASAEWTSTDPDGKHAVSHRVIADHLRASSFLIADGVLPTNEGRGYVLRRIMRRAMRHAHLIGAKDPLLWRLVPTLISEMGTTYPELTRAQALIVDTLRLEEERFRQTLERGLKLLEEEAVHLKAGDCFSGKTAFRLYDTYGFPLDLTQDVLKTRDISVDEDGFYEEMTKQKAAARAAWAGSGDEKVADVWLKLRDRLPATQFLGYDCEVASGKVLALIKGSQEVSHCAAGEDVFIVTEQTPFYGESGGQQGDMGVLIADGLEIVVKDTIKRAEDLHIHVGHVRKGKISIGDNLEMKVDSTRRQGLKAHHSATHLLHASLRRRFGEGVVQKGSFVSQDRLRFDFSCPHGLDKKDLQALERDINGQIRANVSTYTLTLSPEQALEEGAMALFGEKYGEEVRVVKMGRSQEDAPYSIELCGGTHVSATGEIGFFKILSEASVSAGVRRIEAVAGLAAEDYVSEEEKILLDVSKLLKVPSHDVVPKLSQLLEDRKKLERDLKDVRQKTLGASEKGAEDIRIINQTSLLVKIIKDADTKDLRSLMDHLKKTIKSGVVALFNVSEGKVTALTGVTSDLTARYNAGDLIKEISSALGGAGGGGRPDLAQCGGNDPSKITTAIAALEARIQGN
jgi:alanyl-tRNA synthetase